MRVLCVYFGNGPMARGLQKAGPQDSGLQRLAEIFYRLSPQIAVRSVEGDGGALFLEISQCRRLYTEEGLTLRVRALLKRLGLGAHIVVAEDVPTALAMARFQVTEKKNLPIEALFDFASPFERDPDVFRKCEKMLVALKQLGLVRLEEILKLRPQEIATRFGEVGTLVYLRSMGSTGLLWPPFKPVDEVTERTNWAQERSIENIEELFFALKTLVDQILLRLFGRGERLLSFELTLDLERNSMLAEPQRLWRFDLSLPQNSPRNILSLIRERLQSDFGRKNIEAPVVGLQIRVLEVAPSLHVQRDLFNPKREQDQENWNTLVSRLAVKLGQTKVFVAEPRESYLPEKSWERVMGEMDADGEVPLGTMLPFPQRPTRLLKKPQPLYMVGQRLHFGEKVLRMSGWEGPEILSGEWWDEPFERMYFRVQADTGEELWVYRVPGSDQVFVHGVFD